ncbi:hypothetical protein, partial [Paenibacillus sp.]|uniref:hypothetical protein n=1 Tax=Paenibacillus sp. TaxID=58172 RepID=UPI002D624391
VAADGGHERGCGGWLGVWRRRGEHKICAVREEEHQKRAVAADGGHERGCGGWLGVWRSAATARNLSGLLERAQKTCGRGGRRA